MDTGLPTLRRDDLASDEPVQRTIACIGDDVIVADRPRPHSCAARLQRQQRQRLTLAFGLRHCTSPERQVRARLNFEGALDRVRKRFGSEWLLDEPNGFGHFRAPPRHGFAMRADEKAGDVETLTDLDGG